MVAWIPDLPAERVHVLVWMLDTSGFELEGYWNLAWLRSDGRWLIITTAGAVNKTTEECPYWKPMPASPFDPIDGWPHDRKRPCRPAGPSEGR